MAVISLHANLFLFTVLMFCVLCSVREVRAQTSSKLEEENFDGRAAIKGTPRLSIGRKLSSEVNLDIEQLKPARSLTSGRLGHTRVLADSKTKGDWKKLTSLPADAALGEVSAGILYSGDRPYLLLVGQAPGGSSGHTSTMIYDIVGDIWHEGTPRKYVGHHHGSETVGDEFLLLGGLLSGSDKVQIASLIDTDTGGVDVVWSYRDNVPVPSGSAATAVLGRTVIYCGGINEADTHTVGDCFEYNPSKGQWGPPGDIPDMPKPRNHAATCTDGKSMFVFGGRSGNNSLGKGYADTQIYTPGKGWSEGAPLPVARGGTGKSVYLNGECYVFGGEVDMDTKPDPGAGITSAHTVTRVDVYNIASDSWREAEDMPEGLHGIFPVENQGIIYIAAGGTEAGYSQSTVHYAFAP